MERRSPNRRVGGRTERAESEFGAPIEPSSRRTKEADETGWAWGKSATCCRHPAGRTDFAFKDGSSGRMPEARSDEVERAESEFGAPIVPSPNTLKRGHRTKRGCGTGVMECRGIESAKHHYSNTPFLPASATSSRRLFQQPDDFVRMRALDGVVAFHNYRGPAAGFGALIKTVEVVLLRHFALVHGEDVGRR